MELTDPSIITSSINGEVETTPNASANNRNGQENDLQQFIKFLRNKNDSSKSPGDSSTVDEFHEQPIETTIESIVDYKPDLTESSKIYVYSINELLDITKTIPKEFIEEKADSLPRKKFWRLYQKYPDNSNHKSNYRNSNNNGNNSKSRSYSNDNNSMDRKSNNNNANNNNKSKNGKNNNNKKNSNKSMTLTNDELEFDANFESSGNAIADFEAWKSQMKEMERQKKLGIVNHASSSSSLASGKGNPGMNQNDNAKNTSSKLANTQSSIISDFLNLSRNNASNGPMNSGTIPGNNQSSVSTPHESPETKQLGINPTLNETTDTRHVNDKQNPIVQPADLSRSSSSRFTSFFSSASSSSSAKPLNTETNNDQHVKTQQQNQPVSNDTQQKRNQGAGGSKLMGFFNAPVPAPTQTSQSDASSTTNNNSNGLPRGPQQKQQQLPQQQPMQIPPQQMQMHPQQMGMQPGNNTFFQNLLNKNKANETRTDSNDQQFGQMQMPPPGMGGHPMGHQMAGPPPGMNGNFNNTNNDNSKNKVEKNKNDTQNNNIPLQGMPHPQMGMPPMPPHMMQGNFNMPPPGFSGFPGQGPTFPLAPIQRDDDNNDKNTSGKNGKSKNNGPQGPMQQQNFMHMMGPPPPGFMPMHGMPPNMQLPNGMMMPPFHPQQQQQKDGKDVKNIQGGPQPGFFPQQMQPHPNFPMNPNMMPPQNQMRMNNGPNQNKK